MGRFEYQGYSFATAKEMDLAQKEVESITYIKAKMDFKERDKLRKLYDSLCEKQAFVTPIGIAFMKELYEEVNMYSATSVPGVPVTIPVEVKQGTHGKFTNGFIKDSEKKMQEKREFYYAKLRNSRIVITFLVLIIIGLFAAVIFADNSPLKDAEAKLQDKYINWEEQLKLKEQELNQREQELNLP